MGLPCVKCRRARKSQRGVGNKRVACAYFRQKCNIKTLNKCQTTTPKKKKNQTQMQLEGDATVRILHMSLQGLALRIRPVCRCDKCDKLTWLSELLYRRSRLVIWYEFAIYTDNFLTRHEAVAFCVQRGVFVIMVLPTATSQEATVTVTSKLQSKS